MKLTLKKPKKIDMSRAMYTAALPFCASREFGVQVPRWVNERRGEVFDFITEQLFAYHTATSDAPKKCIAVISPHLANSIECHNPVEFASIVLGVKIDFKISWLLKDIRLQLEIS